VKEVDHLVRLLVTWIAVCLLAASGAYGIVIEAETMVASYNAGGSSIYITTCSGASGGQAVDGIDTPGDWIEVVIDLAGAGSYADSLRSAGLLDAESDLTSTVIGGGMGGADLVSSYHTSGLGIG
jgi:hypothetical protein